MWQKRARRPYRPEPKPHRLASGERAHCDRNGGSYVFE